LSEPLFVSATARRSPSVRRRASRPRRGSGLPALARLPRQARGIEKRRRLYEAAVAQFAEQGFETARVEEIVAAAGTSWGTFFRYFPRKEDVLLEAGAIEYRVRVRPAVERGLREALPAREIALDGFRSLMVSRHPPHVHGAMLREIMATPDRFAQLLEPDQPPFVVLLARVLAHGQQRGEVVAEPDPLTLAAVLMAGTLFVAVQGAYGDLRALRALPGRTSPQAVLERAFVVAWRAVEAP
jgi:TetR/AcrR family transcriptional regulator, repressor for uid operon